jgi:hypothetical protein
MTFNAHGCEYLLHSGASATGTLDVAGCSGSGMTFTSGGGCVYTIPAQSGVGPVEYKTLGSGGEREIETTVYFAPLQINRSGNCFAQSFTAQYYGTWDIAGSSGVWIG